MTDNPRRQYTSSPKQWDKLKSAALQMRHESTSAESVLWHRIRNRQVSGAKFRRQHAIDGFVVDFACIDKWLIIEVDGRFTIRLTSKIAMLSDKQFWKRKASAFCGLRTTKSCVRWKKFSNVLVKLWQVQTQKPIIHNHAYLRLPKPLS